MCLYVEIVKYGYDICTPRFYPISPIYQLITNIMKSVLLLVGWVLFNTSFTIQAFLFTATGLYIIQVSFKGYDQQGLVILNRAFF